MFSDWKKRLCKKNLKPIIKEVVHDLPRLATVLLIEYRLKTPDNTLYITTPDKALFIESQCSAESETLSCFPATAGIVKVSLYCVSLHLRFQVSAISNGLHQRRECLEPLSDRFDPSSPALGDLHNKQEYNINQ